MNRNLKLTNICGSKSSTIFMQISDLGICLTKINDLNEILKKND